MEAKVVTDLPAGEAWQYEPKWDGFRCIIEKRRASVDLTAKSGKSLSRFFPEVVAAFRNVPLQRFILDGELVIEIEGRFSFYALKLRLHPAATRIAKLSSATPARYIAFDCLSDGSDSELYKKSFIERRARLEAIAGKLAVARIFEVTKYTRDRKTAMRWLTARHGDTDGVVAKRLDLKYQFGERAMQKIKPRRTADCVVGGFRYEQKSRNVGSLLLGLFDGEGRLNHVGFTSSIPSAEKRELTNALEALRGEPGFTGARPGGPSRWSNERSEAWEPLKPKLVVEVSYDHVTGGRFRHGTRLIRWRPDKVPRQCTMDQIA